MRVAWSSKRARRGSFPTFVLILVVSISSPLRARRRRYFFAKSLASVDGASHSARCEEIVLLSRLSASEVIRDESVLLAERQSGKDDLSLETSTCVLLLNWCVLPLATAVGRTATLGSAELFSDACSDSPRDGHQSTE